MNTSIVGIDPSTTSLGFSIVSYDTELKHFCINKSGCIKSSKSNRFKRLQHIWDKLEYEMSTYMVVGADAIALEKPYIRGGRRADTAIALGEARGVIIVSLAKYINCTTIIDLDATSVKKTITGSGRSDKNEVRKILAERFMKPFQNNDESDAVAIAITGLIEKLNLPGF